MKIKALIADDEPLARERLRFLLSGQEEVEVAGRMPQRKGSHCCAEEEPV